MGVPESVVPEMAAKAARYHCTPTNPRPVTAQDYERMMRESLGA